MVPVRPIVLEQSLVQHMNLQPVADPNLMANLAAWQEKLAKETKEMHARSFADLVSSQKETQAQLLATQQSVVAEQAKA